MHISFGYYPISSPNKAEGPIGVGFDDTMNRLSLDPKQEDW